MGLLSFGVLFYQALIAAIIIFAATKCKKVYTVAVVLAVLWTLSHVFYPPLMIIQFLTIIGSAIYGYKQAVWA